MSYSVIIPTRNRRVLVDEAIASVLAQQSPAAEIIVVDDQSNDGTPEFLTAKYGNRLQIVHTPNLGPGPARNAGAAAATGKILMFLDSDDCWLPDHAARLLAKCEEGYELAYGVTTNHNQLDQKRFFIPDDGDGHEGRCFEQLCSWCFLVPSSMAITTHAFHAVGGFPDLPRGEDWSFFLALAHRFAFGFVPFPAITLRRLHAGSLCAKADKLLLEGMLTRMIEHLTKMQGIEIEKLLPIVRLQQWTTRQLDSWPTIQAWYSALLEDHFFETSYH